VPQFIVDQANRELDVLADTLAREGATVYRPKELNFVELDGMYNYCPRDRILVAGTALVDVNMMYPCRNQEIKALYRLTAEANTIFTMPRLVNDRYGPMVLDAANICRLGNTWLYLLSDSGNQQAADWLQQQLPDITIETCNFYSGVHIDSTITPLRQGFVVLNSSRVTPQNCPRAFDGWTKLWVTDVETQDFYQYPYASKWIGMNMLSVDPNTVIVDKQQYKLIEDLERAGFTTIPLQMRHARTLGGGFHCVTLDLIRE
jgi:N-dimethylarginine dimethylaminohydrolase